MELSFRAAVPEETLADLRDRLARTRFIDDFPSADGWDYGVSRSYLQELCDYWRTTFDWRAQEATSTRSTSSSCAPTVSRSDSSISVRPIPTPCRSSSSTDGPDRSSSSSRSSGRCLRPPPTAPMRQMRSTSSRRRSPATGFGPTVAPGWGSAIAAAFDELMSTLGYERYGAAGGDWGAVITTQLARARTGVGTCADCTHLTPR